MITEDYVSFEVAKLLKEKGFECEKESITAMYNEIGKFHPLSTAAGEYDYYDYNDFDEYDYIAPTLQMAMKWLREVHNIHVVPKFDFYAGYYTGRIYDGTVEKDDYIAIVGNSTYEATAEAAIKYCLKNLI